MKYRITISDGCEQVTYEECNDIQLVDGLFTFWLPTEIEGLAVNYEFSLQQSGRRLVIESEVG